MPVCAVPRRARGRRRLHPALQTALGTLAPCFSVLRSAGGVNWQGDDNTRLVLVVASAQRPIPCNRGASAGDLRSHAASPSAASMRPVHILRRIAARYSLEFCHSAGGALLIHRGAIKQERTLLCIERRRRVAQVHGHALTHELRIAKQERL